MGCGFSLHSEAFGLKMINNTLLGFNLKHNMKLHLVKPLATYGVRKPKVVAVACSYATNCLLTVVDQPIIQARQVLVGNSYATVTEGYFTSLYFTYCGLAGAKSKKSLIFRQRRRGY